MNKNTFKVTSISHLFETINRQTVKLIFLIKLLYSVQKPFLAPVVDGTSLWLVSNAVVVVIPFTTT